MKNETSKGLLRLALFLLFAICVVAFTISRISHPTSLAAAGRAGIPTADMEKVRRLLMDGVGSQVSFASGGAGREQVQASVDSVQRFIRQRSGLQLAPESATRLADIESLTLDGNNRRISCDELSDTVLAVMVERFRRATDAEIEQAADDLSNSKVIRKYGHNRPGASKDGGSRPAGGSVSQANAVDAITLRADGEGLMSRNDFIQAAEQYRMRMNVPVQMIAIIGVVRPSVRQAFQRRLAMLSQALPDQWGDSSLDGLTPLHALLLTYSVVADDAMFRSNDGLKTTMEWVEGVNRKGDASYPASAGRLPYGTNGYLFSTPLNLIFDVKTTNRLLDRLAERTSNGKAS